MRIYKFGGASLKDSNAIQNIFSILNKSVRKGITQQVCEKLECF